MANQDDEPAKPPSAHVVGQDVALLSVAELRERIDSLKNEIVRLEREVALRGATKSAAEQLFRR